MPSDEFKKQKQPDKLCFVNYLQAAILLHRPVGRVNVSQSGTWTVNRVSARMGVVHLLLPVQLPGTHWAIVCVIRCLALTVSYICLKLGCFQSTSTYSALEVSHFVRCINSRLTYLLKQTAREHVLLLSVTWPTFSQWQFSVFTRATLC